MVIVIVKIVVHASFSDMNCRIVSMVLSPILLNSFRL